MKLVTASISFVNIFNISAIDFDIVERRSPRPTNKQQKLTNNKNNNYNSRKLTRRFIGQLPVLSESMALDFSELQSVTSCLKQLSLFSERIHLIPKWPPPGKSWGELHENEVMRAKCAFVL